MADRILMIGPLPDPKGGVSIHIKRLGEMLSTHFDVKYVDESPNLKREYFNLRTYNFLAYFKLILWSDIVHIHSGLHILRIFHLFFSKLFFSKAIVTYHNTPKENNLGFIRSYLKLFDKVIFVNKETSDKLRLKKNSVVKEAFIPQNMDIEPTLPENISGWVNKKKTEGYIILAANAWRLDFHKQEDLYGLDMCIELIYRLKTETNKHVAFAFNVSSSHDNNSYFNLCLERIKNLGIENEFLLTMQNLSFVKVVELSDVVLRPTNTDGDALTIREALYMGVPVIASDVVKRPSWTITFACRNNDDLLKVTDTTIDNLDFNKRILTKSVSDNYSEFYNCLYQF